MSQAFVKEEDEQSLHDIPGTMAALVNYLTRSNNGIRVYEQKTFYDECSNKTIHEMSNGLSYLKDNDGKWAIIL